MIRPLLALATLLLALPAKAALLTHLPATHMLATELTQGTELTVTYLPPRRYGLTRLPAWFDGQGEATVAKAAQSADAVITLGSIWPADPLYPHARAHNIRVVELDASRALTPKGSSVVTRQMADGATSPYVWLSPANLARMADILAADLKALYPAHAERIAQNETALKQAITQLQRDQQQALMASGIDAVVLLDDRLEDFVSGNSLFVLARNTKPALTWTDEDKAELKALAEEEGALVLLSAGKVPASVTQGLENVTVLTLDSLDRWASGIDAKAPLKRWQLNL
ncbi:metal ABC transporter solute-binding protein, Zn/Mn family [Ferrimonas balearica]|uniref:metal ABC transporter solute-binding protein, Zn/Mn family n=1 Tax=Ferrimonas balearica TaxID=44012 RepID=UPI001C999C3B|nr:zinc ABC transporter substrate-binding protein [Ferrimonas balearica]MBY5991478.1 zinc ABC transporter substrate-binding protein [Ferrimonas balearica]